MNKISNQEVERYYFEKFRKDYQLPPGIITYGDSPDVIIEGKTRIGIEITNFFHKRGSLPESEQVQAKFREQVLSEAQRIYETGGGKKTSISFGFDTEDPIRDKKELIRKLVDLAEYIEKFKEGEIRKELFQAIPELSFVHLNTEQYEDARWRVVQVYDVPTMSRERLAEIVRDKEARARKYRRCDSLWLLVVVDFINPAQDQEIQIDDFDRIKTDTFDKVIVYKPVFGHVVEAK